MIRTPFSPRRPKLPRYAECACGEIRKAAVHWKLADDGAVKCMNCSPRHNKGPGCCYVCKREGLPLEDNHIGFAVAPDLTKLFCLNCHNVFSWKTFFLAKEAKRIVESGVDITPELKAHFIKQGKAVIAIMTEELESS
jgi:hypothetical protein